MNTNTTTLRAAIATAEIELLAANRIAGCGPKDARRQVAAGRKGVWLKVVEASDKLESLKTQLRQAEEADRRARDAKRAYGKVGGGLSRLAANDRAKWQAAQQAATK
ncbi:MAG: hypothetical protein UU48_C0013G0012 [Candidatus Uhrbacteria bacterium GW2011_GWF2_41_16]|uniref:Uncharacterized protein n=2 Tax=Candidatus Uhriibacteriota TaxID=1752732 RepID=A0A0G0YB38_9BACT|nr:MAG: hypothetical protein UU35_C0012G0012 [Candidatus Uhrbacteria bacterium GW2011_GWC2_41_11]KKR97522.1 MAG: hypothetical protein UU48_C0013G0012 [Candidatus Uhrbacteria bacterium GW2011_GWF2_41_16]HBP00023.1 hypothetical protein [Candidatus Uhrbacteria bacterium]